MNKYIKKIFTSYIVLIMLLSNTNFLYAENSVNCKIQDTPKYMIEYIKTVRLVVSNTNKAVSQKIKADKIILPKNQYINKIYWAYNTLFSWNSYELGFEYIIWEDELEIPNQLKRDVKLLEKESANIKLANIRASWVEIQYESICKWIDEKICGFEKDMTYESIEVITKLKKSTSQIQKILENQATDFNLQDKKWIILFSDENFELLKDDYSKQSIQSCNIATDSSWEKWFFWTILESFENISLLTSKNENTKNEWQQAIDLLWWSADTMEYKQVERQVLASELQKQWIWWDSSSAIMSNLDAYNKDWTILGWKYGALNSLKEQVTAFEEAIRIEFPEYESGWVWNTNKSSKIIMDKIWKIKTQEKKILTINYEYSKLKEISFSDDKSDTILIDRMIDIHLSISDMVNTLNKTCEIAVKVCNSQKRWQWDCGQCY